MSVEVGLTGPLFDGRAEAAVEAFANDVEERVAEAVVQDVRLTLDREARNPTGRYRNSVRAERNGGGWSATDGGRLRYGTWLEGTSRRNRSTGFRGFHAFELAQAEAERQVNRIAEQAFPVHKRRME